MFELTGSIYSQNNIQKILIYLFALFPISFLIGNLVINLFIGLIALTFLLLIFKINKNLFFKNNSFLILILFFFWISLIINLFFSQNYELGLPRVIKFFFIICTILAFRLIISLNEENKINIIYKFWTITFLVVVADLTFEFINGQNLIGITSYMPGRLASFTGDELVIGSYFSAFSLICLSFIYKKIPKKNYLIIFLSLTIIVISLLIGERSNFVKSVFIVFIFVFFALNLKFKFKVIILLISTIIVLTFLNFSGNYKYRYHHQVSLLFKKDGIKNYLNNSQYGALYKVASIIYSNNKIFGVGIKNFRIESQKEKYQNFDHPYNKLSSTHPHQIHYEFLSETGLFGYISFLLLVFFSVYLSLKSYLQKKNLYQLSGMLFVLVSLLPLLPSGSFFSTYFSGLFWINYSLMTGYIKN